MPLLLASASPRRRELLSRIGLAFTTARPDIDETPRQGEAPDAYVLRLSLEKSAAIAADGMILTADTTVADGTAILGKPADAADATAILTRLRGRAHIVYTAIALRDTHSGQRHAEVTATAVRMRAYTDGEIAAYVASGEPFDKAGAYAIQNADFHPAVAIDGCYANVMGLPLCTLCQLLEQHGVMVPDPVACRPEQSACVIGSVP